MSKYLILTASYGNGHNAAKDALCEELKNRGQEVRVLDLVDFLARRWGRTTRKFYEFSEYFSVLWRLTYAFVDTKFMTAVTKKGFALTSQKDFDRYMEEYQPDQVICVFPNWWGFLDNYFRHHEKKCVTSMIITDSVRIGSEWYMGWKSIDFYFTIDDITKATFCAKFHHDPTNVHVSFFPIKSTYFQDKKHLSLDRVVFLCTGLWYILAVDMISLLLREEKMKCLTVVKGRNEYLYELLKNRFSHEKLEFVEYMNFKESFSDFDVLVSKPGGAVMCECIAQDVFLVAPYHSPGQEEGNAELLNRAGVWVYESNPKKIVQFLHDINLDDYLPNFGRLKNKNSVNMILDIISQ